MGDRAAWYAAKVWALRLVADAIEHGIPPKEEWRRVEQTAAENPKDVVRLVMSLVAFSRHTAMATGASEDKAVEDIGRIADDLEFEMVTDEF